VVHRPQYEKRYSARQKDGQLKPLATRYEPRRGASGSRGWRRPQLLVSGGWHSIEFLLDHLLQFSYHAQVWVDIAFFLPVKNLLTIQIHFEPAICTGGERDRDISTKGTKKLVRHPRGGRVMFSSDAVHNVHEHFPLRSHLYPPSYELSADTVRKKAFSLIRILHFITRKSNGRTDPAVLGQRRGR
jgi:hypothetical protein